MPIPSFDLAEAERLAVRVANAVKAPLPLADWEDAKQEAWTLILRYWTAEAFEASGMEAKGVPFAAWLFMRVRGDTIDVYKKERRRQKGKRRVHNESTYRRGNRPSYSSPSFALQISSGRERRRGTSPGGTEDQPAFDYAALQSPRRATEEEERQDRRITIQAAVDSLPERQRFVVTRIFVEAASQQQVAAELGVSQPVVSKIQAQALARLSGVLTPENV